MAVENIAKTSHLLNPYGNAEFGTWILTQMLTNPENNLFRFKYNK